MPKFSIIIPVRNRPLLLVRAVNSILHQTRRDWELILIEDGSKDATPEVVRHFKESDGRIKAIYHKKPRQRCASRNAGFDAATGEWLCCLDSDDEWLSIYLEVMEWGTHKYPQAQMFNCGAIVCHKRVLADGERTYGGTSFRRTWTPKWDEEKGYHEEFKAGKMGTGQFIFKRECWGQVERLPEVLSPYKMHELATDTHHLYPYPARKDKGHRGSLGNPWGCTGPLNGGGWGDDYLLLYRLTRKFRMWPLEPCLYIHHIR